MTSRMPAMLRIIAFAPALLFLHGCKAPRPAAMHKTFLVMGTVASVALPPDASSDLERVADLVTETISRLEQELSVYRPDSEISRVNAQAGRSPVPVSESTLNVLQLAGYYSELSDGAFDATVGPFMKIWGLTAGARRPPRPPSDETLRALRPRVGWRHVVLSDAGAFLNEEGMELDLGAIAKGYAVDVSCHKLLGHGVRNALLDLGGNIRCLGSRRGNEPWTIGVRNPFRPDRMLGTLRLAGGEAVATSGNYERFVTINGQRYAHIVDPRTGRPAQGMASVTVVSHSAAEADALSTALFVQGAKQGVLTLQKTSSREAMFIPDKRPVEIWVTPEFARRFSPEPSVSGRVFKIEF